MTSLRIQTPHAKLSASFDEAGDGPVLAVAHGAGGSIDDPLLAAFASELAGRGVACLRFNFPYRERGAKMPDREPVLREAWAAAFERAGELGGPVWVGGKSLGGRIASLAVADGLAASGLVFLGYPLHPPGRPERIRDAHLPKIRVPMLFLQGTNDAFARPDLLSRTIERLGALATLHPVEGGDHSFRVRGVKRDDAGTGRALAEVAAAFIREHS